MKALVCFLLLLLLLATLPSPTRSFEFPAREMADLIDQTCRLTPFYDLCISSLRSDPESGAADVRGLARIMAGSVLATASRTLDRIQELLGQAPDPETERPLAYCAELYIPVVKYTLPQAIEALGKGQLGFAVYGLSDAGKEAEECEKNLSGQGGSPVTEGNELVRNLVDVAVAIIEILQRSF
ncbi:cell wall / vacuolar inhibitor of fructosidase 1-like isoform X1 [Rhodamnia argentea]|uniref:Cell wall / vacuolar inhibitor of fructosidase 1-like isoform X1 n=1 Tax=Rhodamnia argentea TaxID=178133 RepID=A0ABM3HLS4_9MYRT|nr:cell wall / vacuolar inhibitor of fructosidase 1-like isoform X1 [Rhodamnia argentea]